MTDLFNQLITCMRCGYETIQFQNAEGALKSCRRCGFRAHRPTVLKGTSAPSDPGPHQKYMAVWYLKSIGVTAEQYQQLLDELE